MDKLFTLILTCALTFFMFFGGAEKAHAQDLEDSPLVTNPGDITLGIGVTRGSSTGFLENPEFGLTAQLFFTVTERIRTGTDFTLYMIGERDLSANELNLNVHYLARNRGILTVYGLGGFNLSNTSGSDELWREERNLGAPNTRKVGLNIGAGLELRFGNVVVYGEPKVTLFGGSQFVATAGLRYIL